MENNNFSNREQLTKKDFATIYQEYQKKVFDFVYKRTNNKEVAEDLTSEIFEKILKTIEDFQWQGVSLSAWIFRIARNHIIDHYRKSNKFKNDRSFEEVANMLISTVQSLEYQIEGVEEEIALYNSLRELTSEEQSLIYYKFFEEMSNKEIAQLTKISESNIGTKLHRIRKKLAKILNKSYQ